MLLMPLWKKGKEWGTVCCVVSTISYTNWSTSAGSTVSPSLAICCLVSTLSLGMHACVTCPTTLLGVVIANGE